MGQYLVTGSAGGICGAIQRRIEAEGHDVIGMDLAGAGADIDADLSSAGGRRDAIDAAIATVGSSLDGLVVCAGLPPTIRPVSMIAEVNYFGSVELLDALRPLLAAEGGGSAVAISSNSLGTVPLDEAPLIGPLLEGDVDAAVTAAAALHGASVYGMSKQALARAVRRRAPDWAADGVRLNSVAPGAVETALLDATLDDPELGPVTEAFPIPVGRRGTVDDIADAVWFVLAEAPFMVGSVLFVDGGSDALMRPDAV
jgi:NAD(P)-dependent dehydrogenase (short-subunit alcohol dehydrogenase family)